jgi:hypothetical protein
MEIDFSKTMALNIIKKSNRLFVKIFSLLLVFILSPQVFSETKKKPVGVIQLNREFYTNLLNTKPLERDIFLGEMQDNIVQGVGFIESVDRLERYHRHIRITATDKEASGLIIKLFIFADNEEYLTLLQKGDSFDFKGQFVIFTPLNSRRDAYIFDIILEEGALSVK